MQSTQKPCAAKAQMRASWSATQEQATHHDQQQWSSHSTSLPQGEQLESVQGQEADRSTKLLLFERSCLNLIHDAGKVSA